MKLFNNIGVMQGRLLPKYKGRYQAHPLGYWQKEFSIANSFSLSHIEFIFDYNDYLLNPLMSENGLKEILDLSNKYNVKVKSVCADFFMELPIHSDDDVSAQKSVKVLKKIISACGILNISDIVLPCVDQSSLKTNKQKLNLAKRLESVYDQLEKHNINIALETDLSPKDFSELLKSFSHDKITVNYDTGNSASLGYNPIEEFEYYGDKISDIHIKDRLLNGGSVILGEGSTNFEECFNLMKSIEFNGPLIMQVYRDDEGLDVFERQLNWLKENFNK